jgi:hypothetical protein
VDKKLKEAKEQKQKEREKREKETLELADSIIMLFADQGYKDLKDLQSKAFLLNEVAAYGPTPFGSRSIEELRVHAKKLWPE